MKKKIIASVVAGKLTVGVAASYAGGLGKIDSGPVLEIPQLSIDEIGSPFEILTNPGEDSGSKEGGVGTLYANIAQNQSIDFLISGVRKDRPVQVFLAFSRGLVTPEQSTWLPLNAGRLELDPSNGIELIAGFIVRPQEKAAELPPTTLGEVRRDHESIILPVQLSDLANLGEDGTTLYFQALAIPLGPDPDGPEGPGIPDYQWDLAQASEVDAFRIDRHSAGNNEYESLGKTGGDGQDSGKGGQAQPEEPADTGGK